MLDALCAELRNYFIKTVYSGHFVIENGIIALDDKIIANGQYFCISGGRMQSYSDLEKDGCAVEREWIAAIDSRTRHAHQVLDGQKRKNGVAFVYDGDEIMYPGDPTAKPYLVYNCRCTLAAEIVAYKGKDVRSSQYEAGKIGDDTDAFEKKREVAEK